MNEGCEDHQMCIVKENERDGTKILALVTQGIVMP